eukprot:gene23082-29908_t
MHFLQSRQSTLLLHSTSRSGDGFAGLSKEPTVDRRTYSWKDGSPNNHRNTNSNNNRRDSSSNDKEKERDSARNTWKSGYVLVNDRGNRGNRRLRNDPWWMQEEEKNNPRMLPEYNPVWKSISGTDFEDSSVLKEVLVNEAKLRGLSTSGKKAELLERLREYASRHSLSDDNFRAPQYSSTNALTLPTCYPEVYEGFLGIQELQEKISQMSAPISNAK